METPQTPPDQTPPEQPAAPAPAPVPGANPALDQPPAPPAPDQPPADQPVHPVADATPAPAPEEQQLADVVSRLPILGSGDSDPTVLVLGVKLAALGYENSVSRGENHGNVVDESVLRAVQQWRADNSVAEDPTPHGGNNPTGLSQAANVIGPETWTGLLELERDEPPAKQQGEAPKGA